MHQPAPAPRLRSVRRARTLILCALASLPLAALACGGGATSPTPILQPPAPSPSPDPPGPPPPPPTLGVTRILAFGDSMTAGTTSAPLVAPGLTAGLPQSYPFKLQDLLTTRYSAQPIVVLNAGSPGEHIVSSPALKRFGDAVSEAKPDLILLMEGANDLNDAKDQVNATITAAVSALEEMVKDAGRRRIPIMVGTLPPQRPPKGTAAPYIGKFNDALKVMAAKKGGILVDVNAQMPESLIGQDGLHPTEAGYQRLAEIYRDAIKSQYEAAPATAAAAASALSPIAK